MSTDPTSSSSEETEEAKKIREEKEKEKKARARRDRNLQNIQQYILSQNINTTKSFYESNKEFFAYRMFRQINGPSSKIVTKLRGLPDLSPFLNIPNSVLSLMHPKIKIYRVTYEEMPTEDTFTDADGNSRPDTVPLRTPCYREFKFTDNFGAEHAASPEDYLAYESTKASWRNVGLHSFEVKQIGTSHGAVEHNIECRLKIKLKSMKDLAAQPPGEPIPKLGGLRYVDLILHPGAKIDSETEQYNPSHYEIKVLLGYHALSTEMIANITDDLTIPETKKLLENMSKLNVVLALGLRDYDFDINDNGSVDLTARYWGRIETTLNNVQANIFQESFRIDPKAGSLVLTTDANIKNNFSSISKLSAKIRSVHSGLKAPNCEQGDCESKKQLKGMLKTTLFQVVAKEAGMPTKLADAEAWMKDADKAQSVMTALQNKSLLLQEEVYSSFMSQLIEGNPAGNGTRLFCASANKEKVQEAWGYINSATDKEKKVGKIAKKQIIESTSVAIGGASKTLDISRCSAALTKKTAQIKNQTAAQITAEVRAASDGQDGSDSPEPPARDDTSIIGAGGDSAYKYYFVFLGDVIELACKNAGLRGLDFSYTEGPFVYRNNSYIMNTESAPGYGFHGVRLLLGPVEYYDKEGILQNINLAQFPISFELFREWFLHAVIKRKRIRMPVGSFITKIINQLVLPSLGTKFIRPAKPPGTRSQSITLSLPGAQLGGAKVEVCGRQVSKTVELLPFEREIDVETADFDNKYGNKVKLGISDESHIRTSYDYWLVQVSSIRDIKLREGSSKVDMKDGIYHFNIGADRGLLKKMKFKKSELSGLSEMRSLQAIESGGDQLQQLREPYDCNLTLIGNTLFTPGMLFYANPSFIGLGSPRDPNSLANNLNLGGYFAIMTTKLFITSGKFETTIEGKTLGQGRKTGV